MKHLKVARTSALYAFFEIYPIQQLFAKYRIKKYIWKILQASGSLIVKEYTRIHWIGTERKVNILS